MSDSIVGTEIDGYRIVEVLRRGAVGVVYRAEDVALSRTVALKRINPSLAQDEASVRRFRAEARTLAQIDSPYVAGVHALRETEKGLFTVMEYVQGPTVRELLADGPLDWQRIRPILTQTLTALEHAHAAGVVHRDIKPDSIKVGENGRVKVIDFGLAKLSRAHDLRTVIESGHDTVHYLSPEQVQGEDVDARSDVYSVGVTLFEMLTGELPFDEEDSEFAVLQQIVEEEFPRPEEVRPQVPKGIGALVKKALSKAPGDRFRSAAAMREAFESSSGSDGESSPPSRKEPQGPSGNHWAVVAGLAVLLALLTIGGYLLYGGEGQSASRSTKMSIATDPTGARVFHQGELLGKTPLDWVVQADTLALRLQKGGYQPVDTTVRVARTARSDVVISLTKVSSEDAPTASQNSSRSPSARAAEPSEPSASARTPESRASVETESGSSQEEESTAPSSTAPAEGHLALRADPGGAVYVNGQERDAADSIRVAAGTHEIQFRHPTYGTKDTVLTVEAGTTTALTCYFEHTLSVRTDGPWGKVFINGTDTGEFTEAVFQRGPDTYNVQVRINRGSYEVSGGRYLRKIGEQAFGSAFSGATKTVRLKPSFEEQNHVVIFHVVE